jgi:hypothetical protein
MAIGGGCWQCSFLTMPPLLLLLLYLMFAPSVLLLPTNIAFPPPQSPKPFLSLSQRCFTTLFKKLFLEILKDFPILLLSETLQEFGNKGFRLLRNHEKGSYSGLLDAKL